MSTQPATEKRGRKPGSSDTVNVTWEQLSKYMTPTAALPVRRAWLKQIEVLHNVSFTVHVSPPAHNQEATVPHVHSEANIATVEEGLAPAPEAVREHVELVEETP